MILLIIQLEAAELNLNVQFNDNDKPLQFKFSDNYEMDLKI